MEEEDDDFYGNAPSAHDQDDAPANEEVSMSIDEDDQDEDGDSDDDVSRAAWVRALLSITYN